MEEKIRNLINSEEELVNSYLKSLVDFDTIADMDEEELGMVKKLKNLMDLSEEVLIEYGETIDKQNKKLDKILELLEK